MQDLDLKPIDEAWNAFRDHTLDPMIGEAVVETMRLAFSVGYLAGLSDLGDPVKQTLPGFKWRTLMKQALTACEARRRECLKLFTRDGRPRAELN